MMKTKIALSSLINIKEREGAVATAAIALASPIRGHDSSRQSGSVKASDHVIAVFVSRRDLEVTSTNRIVGGMIGNTKGRNSNGRIVEMVMVEHGLV
jgi:hypothetical protein